jgi:hypothetical protein
MNNINTFPIETFLEKARIALKTNQKSLNLDIRDVQALYDCLAITMTRLAGESTPANLKTPADSSIQIKMDGGLF